MKTTVKGWLIPILSLIFTLSSFAQSPNDDKLLKDRVTERVALMNSYIKYMADKRNKYSTRQYYSTKALPLFIGKGNAYTLDGEKHTGVVMQTTSTNNDEVKTTLMKEYFKHLIDLKYTDVKITSTSPAEMKVSDLKKIAENTYVCTCQYVQYFYGYRDGVLVYKDRTTKRIECIIEFEPTEDGREPIIRLGDTEAIHTERI